MASKTSVGDKQARGPDQQAQAKVRWSTQSLTSSYANFCNATSTREGVVLDLGVSSKRTLQGMHLELAHRIVRSRFVAKRPSGILDKLIGEYESRYGEPK